MSDEEEIIEEEMVTPEGDVVPKKKKGTKKSPLFGYYGDEFDGKFQKITELTNLVTPFKDFYLTARRTDMNGSSMKIIKDFNESIAPLRFYPYPSQYRRWRKHWDSWLMLEMNVEEAKLVDSKKIRDVIAVRDHERGLTLVPGEEELERGTNTLAGLLMNDAIEQLQNDQENEEIFTSDELIKRKKYVLNVMTEITKKVQGKENLKIKRHAEGRETMGFLEGLLNRARAGAVSADDIVTLKSSIVDVPATQVPEPQTP